MSNLSQVYIKGFPNLYSYGPLHIPAYSWIKSFSVFFLFSCANILPMLHWYYVVLLDSLEFRNITLENRQVYKSVVPDQKKLEARSKKVPIGAQRKLMYVIYITLCHHYVMYFSWCSKLEWCYSCYNFTDPPRCRAVPGKLHATDQPLNSSILVILCSFLVWSNWSNLVLCLFI